MVAIAAFVGLTLSVLVPAGTRACLQGGEGPAAEDVRIGGVEQKRYLLHAPDRDAAAPEQGWRLLVVLPGGDGSAEFAPFVGRIRENTLGAEWLIAQIVAPVWSPEQAEKNVWPTKLNPWPEMGFTCEQLFAEVVADVGAKRELDPRYLFTLAWSSSGTLAYTLGLRDDTPVTGTFVAMSVFKPELLPRLKGGKGDRFWLLHSPEDWIPFAMAEQAQKSLVKAGAEVELTSYAGGHGWHGDVYGQIRTGVDWLERAAKRKR